MTRTIALTIAGLVCSTLWLSLLVASGFSSPAVSLGLLGMLVLMGGRA